MSPSTMGDRVEVSVIDRQIVMGRARQPRAGGEEQFRTMAERGDGRVLDEECPSFGEWGQENWEWSWT